MTAIETLPTVVCNLPRPGKPGESKSLSFVTLEAAATYATEQGGTLFYLSGKTWAFVPGSAQREI